jgi:hypothetical protein
MHRGEPELWIKDLKDACVTVHLSFHRVSANPFRWPLHAADYSLLDALRRLLIRAGIARMQLATLPLRLIKGGDWVRDQVREQTLTLSLHMASSHPSEPLWRILAARFKPGE